jgi:hypothetical protein
MLSQPVQPSLIDLLSRGGSPPPLAPSWGPPPVAGRVSLPFAPPALDAAQRAALDRAVGAAPPMVPGPVSPMRFTPGLITGIDPASIGRSPLPRPPAPTLIEALREASFRSPTWSPSPPIGPAPLSSPNLGPLPRVAMSSSTPRSAPSYSPLWGTPSAARTVQGGGELRGPGGITQFQWGNKPPDDPELVAAMLNGRPIEVRKWEVEKLLREIGAGQRRATPAETRSLQEQRNFYASSIYHHGGSFTPEQLALDGQLKARAAEPPAKLDSNLVRKKPG